MSNKITLNMIFTAAWKAFIIENRPPSLAFTTYQRSDNGPSHPIINSGCVLSNGESRCAIGLVLTDEQLKECPNNAGGAAVLEDHKDWFDPDVTTDDIVKLQLQLHDSLAVRNYNSPDDIPRWAYSVEERRKRYIELALKMGLKFVTESSTVTQVIGTLVDIELNTIRTVCLKAVKDSKMEPQVVEDAMAFVLAISTITPLVGFDPANDRTFAKGAELISMAERMLHIIRTDPFFKLTPNEDDDQHNDSINGTEVL